MDAVQVTISLDLIEDMFSKSIKTREFDICSTLVLELKASIESYLQSRLERGHTVSLHKAFNHCCMELVEEEDDWDSM